MSGVDGIMIRGLRNRQEEDGDGRHDQTRASCVFHDSLVFHFVTPSRTGLHAGHGEPTNDIVPYPAAITPATLRIVSTPMLKPPRTLSAPGADRQDQMFHPATSNKGLLWNNPHIFNLGKHIATHGKGVLDNLATGNAEAHVPKRRWSRSQGWGWTCLIRRHCGHASLKIQEFGLLSLDASVWENNAASHLVQTAAKAASTLSCRAQITQGPQSRQPGYGGNPWEQLQGY
ncbi:hypothetical protein VB005_03612 [Metarhizium brunneum]